MEPTPSFAVPRPLGALLARLPAYPGSVLLVTALNLGLAAQLQADVRQLLLDKKLRIHVRDARLTFDFTWTGKRFAACGGGAPADLTISAGSYDFLQLAQRREDPDTLFFSRRLSMEGDTELGPGGQERARRARDAGARAAALDAAPAAGAAGAEARRRGHRPAPSRSQSLA